MEKSEPDNDLIIRNRGQLNSPAEAPYPEKLMKELASVRVSGDRWDNVGQHLAGKGFWVFAAAGLLGNQMDRLRLSDIDPAWGLALDAASVVGLLCFVVGFACHLHGKKLLAVAVNAEPLSRSPVLYLRSFKADRATSRVLNRVLRFVIGAATWRNLLRFDFEIDALETEEESLARAMIEIGPLVAIGSPGEKLPLLGAVRVYVENESWQARVAALISQSRLVLLRPGKTEGFRWEFQQCALSPDRQKLVLLLPFNRWQYKRFREPAGQLLRCTLPDYEGIGLVGRYGSKVKAIIYFDADGTPHLRRRKKLSDEVYGLTVDSPLTRSLKYALQPVGQRFGQRWG